jgi:Rps23 Pro-64 3,4-dihydroxylase Tpa1-like proline 4-hydroxylase|tara:strand:+ start:1825 stop:2412 length:588 start_codon:yes stop_codon:yes gene_type:complete
LAKEKMELKKYIKIIDNVMPIEDIANLVKFVKKVDYKHAQVGADASVRPDLRKVHDYGLENLKPSLTEAKWSNFLRYLFTKAIRIYINDTVKKNAHEIGTGVVKEVTALKYETGGFYIYHTDYFDAQPRQFSLILMLNNDFEGGEIVFTTPSYEEEYRIKNVPGRLLVWPSNFMFPHKVDKVTKGTRFSIVGWSH